MHNLKYHLNVCFFISNQVVLHEVDKNTINLTNSMHVEITFLQHTPPEILIYQNMSNASSPYQVRYLTL